MKYGLVFLSIILLYGCESPGSYTIDEVPMYGGIDRTAMPELAAADKILIEETSKEFGSRRAASNAFVDRAFRLYRDNDLSTSMKRFNQAWLIDETNPEVYHGIGSVVYDQGDNCGAMETMNKSLNLDWGGREYNKQGFLADLAMVTSLCSSSVGFEKWGSQKSLIKKSDQLFLEAENLGASAYLYDKWWQALYWRDDFSGAWEKVFKMRAEGESPHPSHIKLLNEKMLEPGNN